MLILHLLLFLVLLSALVLLFLFLVLVLVLVLLFLSLLHLCLDPLPSMRFLLDCHMTFARKDKVKVGYHFSSRPLPASSSSSAGPGTQEEPASSDGQGEV